MLRILSVLALSCVSAAALADVVELSHGDSTCTVDTLGGRVLSCRLHGEELFWHHQGAEPAAACWRHGGMPLAWPWFGRIGAGDANIHGYAWKQPFAVQSRKKDELVLELKTASAVLEWSLKLDESLTLALRTTNRSGFEMPFSVAFHPYFKVGECNQVAVEGLEDAAVCITGQVDRTVQFDMAEPIRTCWIRDRSLGRSIRIEARNSTGVNVWNPGREKQCPGVIPGDEWRHFVAVEPIAAGVNRFMVLASGESHEIAIKVSLSKGEPHHGFRQRLETVHSPERRNRALLPAEGGSSWCNGGRLKRMENKLNKVKTKEQAS